MTLCQYSVAHAAETLKITRPWVREAPPSARVLAAYMSIENTGGTRITIIGISSPDFESAELHRTVVNDDVARMLHIRQLDVPANGTVNLAPGGIHLMLFGPKRMLTAGDTVTLTVQPINGTSLTVSAPVVRQYDDSFPHQHQ